MADEQRQPDEQDPLEHEGGPLANQPHQPASNRPAENAQVSGPSAADGFDWAPSDEATDFLGLNDPADSGPSGDPAAPEGQADPYSMPGAGQPEELTRTTWLLNEASQPAQPGNEWQAAPGGNGMPGQTPSWLMDGQEPAPLPAPARGEGQLSGAMQPSAPAATAAPQGTDPNWLLNPNEQQAAGTPHAQEHAAEAPRGLDASFVDQTPAPFPVGKVALRSLAAIAVVAGCTVGWRAYQQSGDLETPLTAPIQREPTARNTRTADQPLEPVPALETPADPARPAGAAPVGNGRTALAPERTEDGERRWFSNLSPRANGDNPNAEPSELDGDSYPWAAPSEQAVADAQAVLLAFSVLMGDTPLASANPANPRAGEDAADVLDSFDSLAVVLPEATPDPLTEGPQVGPPAGDFATAEGDLPPVPRWMTLEERLLSADRSVLDQYNSWRMNGRESGSRSMRVTPRAGMWASVEPTLELPFFVATIGLGATGLTSEVGPMPAADQAEMEALADMDRPGDLPRTADAELVDLERPAETETPVVAEAKPALDPRRIEKDPLFSLQARLPGRESERRELENHWAGVNIPMHALDYPERVLTPRVGGVRAFHKNGEAFEGMLFAMGQGTIWVDTDIGRMALSGNSVRRLERLDASRLAALQRNGTPVAGLEQIRVKTAGGVFVGFQLERNGDRVTMVTEEGYKITLRSKDIEPAASRRATVGIRRPGR